MSKDLIDLLIKDKNKLNYKLPDDVTLCKYLHNNYQINYINEKLVALTRSENEVL